MIFSLTGRVERLDPFFIVIECGGVGYGARIPVNVYQAAVSGGFDTSRELFTLVTRSVYSEDNAQLFGFIDEGEAKLFDFVRSLNGFGPQAAMNILSTMGAAELLQAMQDSDTASLVRVPGVGKTKAEKLCFEAQSKKARLSKIILGETNGAMQAQNTDELVTQALVSLGYSLKEVEQAANKVNKLQEKPQAVTRENLQDWIRLYLRNL